MLDYRMETFITLCEERSYSKAAKRLCITQPAITQHIQYLERYYNAKLFEYTNKQVTLTTQGRILEQYALRMNFTTRQVYEVIAQSQGGPVKLHIGASPTLGELFMPSVLQKVLEYEPKLHIKYVSKHASELLEELKSGTISCAYVEGPFKKEDFEYRLIKTDEIIPVSGTPMRKCDPHDLLSYTLFCEEIGSGLRKTTADLLYHNGLSIENFSNHIQVNNSSVMKHLIKSNNGIGFFYKSYVAEELKEGTLHQIPVDLTTKQEFNFVVLKNCLFLDMYLKLYNFSKDIIN